MKTIVAAAVSLLVGLGLGWLAFHGEPVVQNVATRTVERVEVPVVGKTVVIEATPKPQAIVASPLAQPPPSTPAQTGGATPPSKPSWRRARHLNELSALGPKKRGPKPVIPDARDRIAELEKAVAKAELWAKRAEGLVELQTRCRSCWASSFQRRAEIHDRPRPHGRSRTWHRRRLRGAGARSSDVLPPARAGDAWAVSQTRLAGGLSPAYEAAKWLCEHSRLRSRR